MNPAVSVIMPTYNAEKFVDVSIASVLHQSLANFELIIVDDHSSDGTPAIIQRWAKQDTRIEVKLLGRNVGVANARNIGTKMARGEFVTFLDSDDLWAPNKLELQAAFMQKNGIIFSYCGYELIDESGNVIGERRISESSLTHTQLLKGNRIGLLSVMLVRATALDHPFPEIHHEDYACWLSILREGVTAFRFTDALPAQYRKHQTSLSANKVKAASWTWHIYRSFERMNMFQSLYYFTRYAVMSITDKR